MSAFWDEMLKIKARLAVLPGVKTCKIGLEANLVAEDYPIVRLVPSRIAPLDPRGGIDALNPLLIYYGWNLLEVDVGLEAIYEKLFAWRDAIRTAMLDPDESPLMWEYQDTFFDEDRLDRYKVFVDRYRVVENQG